MQNQFKHFPLRCANVIFLSHEPTENQADKHRRFGTAVFLFCVTGFWRNLQQAGHLSASHSWLGQQLSTKPLSALSETWYQAPLLQLLTPSDRWDPQHSDRRGIRTRSGSRRAGSSSAAGCSDRARAFWFGFLPSRNFGSAEK